MANVIKHKRGTGSDPSAGNLVIGELAIRTDTGKLFTKMDSGAIAEIAGGGSDIAINTLSSSSGTGGGSATFNGSAYRFTLSAPPNVSAAQLLVSINGVIQKPVTGTGQPSEGFAVDGTDIILGDAPATGADFFILTFKSLGVSEPADNSVTSAKIVDGAIVNADINASAAIASSKLAKPIDFADNEKARFGTGNDLEIYHDGSNSYVSDQGTGVLNILGSQVLISSADNTENIAKFATNGSVELYHDNSKKFETGHGGEYGSFQAFNGNNGWDGMAVGNSKFVFMGSNSNDAVGIWNDEDNEWMVKCVRNAQTELQYNGSKKFETKSDGVQITDTNPLVHIQGTGTSGDSALFLDANANHWLIRADNNTGSGTFSIKSGTPASSTHRLLINSSGNVGIGVSTPKGRLDIDASGLDAAGDADDPNDYAIVIRNSPTTDQGNGIAFTNDSGQHVGGAIIHIDQGSNNIGDLAFFTAASSSTPLERVRITANGLLSISAGGSANPWGASFKETGSSNSGRCFFEGINGQANKTFSIMSENGKFRISGGGTAGSATGTELISLLTTTATSWTSGSDERLKENITEISNVLDKIKNYRCARFNFIGDDSSDIQNIKFGFIAQDWVTDFPEVLSLSTRNVDDPTDTTKYYGMQYTETIPVLLKAIQELNAKVETLETKVEALEAK